MDNKKVKGIVKGLLIIGVIIALGYFILSNLHIRIVTADYVGPNSYHDTLELHNLQWERCEKVVYPYGDNHKINIWVR